MRVPFDPQLHLDCTAVLDVELNTNCRDEIIPILAALQYIYGKPELRDHVLDLVGKDVNATSRADCGRTGISYWQILVLASVRLGCSLDYDKLQDLAEQHNNLRHIMGIGGWCEQPNLDWRRIHDNVCLVRPETIEKINHLIVAEGHRLIPEAPKAVRGDSFVAQTNIHYPTESSLIGDGLRKILKLSAELADLIGAVGWRQHQHLHKKVKKLLRQINKIAVGKGQNYHERFTAAYKSLLELAEQIMNRSLDLLAQALAFVKQHGSFAEAEVDPLYSELIYYLSGTEHVCDTARRRVLEGQQVENCEKLFSLFEPHTELIKRGKTRQPIEFGHRVLVIEDAVGFVCHYAILPIGTEERNVVVEEMRTLQQRLGGRIRRASFDRGCHSPENQRELAKIVAHPCLPSTGKQAARQQQEQATVEFRQSRQRHPGIESAIGALQSGNGLDRCRDRTQMGYDRYVGLGILGRNLHLLGKIVIARSHGDCPAAQSRRQRLIA